MVRYVNHHRPYTRWAELCADGTLPCHGSLPDPVFRQIIGLASLFGTAIVLVPLVAILYWKTLGKWAWKAQTARLERESAQRRIEWNLKQSQISVKDEQRSPWSPLTSSAPHSRGTFDVSATPIALNASVGSSTLSPFKATRYPPPPRSQTDRHPPTRTSSYAYVGSSTRAHSIYGIRQSVYGLAGGDANSRDASGSQVSLLGLTTLPHARGPVAGVRSTRREADTSSGSDQSIRNSNALVLVHNNIPNPFADPTLPSAQHSHPLQQPSSPAPHSPGHTPLMSPASKYAPPQKFSSQDQSATATPDKRPGQEQARSPVDRELPHTLDTPPRQRSMRGRYRYSLQASTPDRQRPQLAQRQQYQAQSDNTEINEAGAVARVTAGDPLPAAAADCLRPHFHRTFSDDSLYSHPLQSEPSYIDRDSMASPVSVRSTRQLLADPSSRQIAGGGVAQGSGLQGEWTLDDLVRESRHGEGVPDLDQNSQALRKQDRQHQHQHQHPSRQPFQASLGSTSEGGSIRLVGPSTRVPSSSTLDREEELRRHQTFQRREKRRENERRFARDLAHQLRYLNQSAFAADWGWQWKAEFSRGGSSRRKKGRISSTLRGVKTLSVKGNKSPAPWDGFPTSYGQDDNEDSTMCGQGASSVPRAAHRNACLPHWHYDERALGLHLTFPTQPASQSSAPSRFSAEDLAPRVHTRGGAHYSAYAQSHARSRSGNHLAASASVSRSDFGHLSAGARSGASAKDIETEARLRKAVAQYHGLGEAGPFYR